MICTFWASPLQQSYRLTPETTGCSFPGLTKLEQGQSKCGIVKGVMLNWDLYSQ